MKKCTYWGKEYPEDASICEIDRHPLEQVVPSLPNKATSPPPSCRHSRNHTQIRAPRLFLVGAFSILGSFGGVGVAWVPFALATGRTSKSRAQELVAGSVPLLTLGGALGFIAGLIFALFLFKNRPPSAQSDLERKYIGGRGFLIIYSGLPMFFTVLFLMLGHGNLERVVGVSAAAYAYVLVLMFASGVSLYFYDKIPRTLILPIGLLGWILLIAFLCWFFWVGPGAFRYH